MSEGFPQMPARLSIANRPIGKHAAVYIIAELGVNHDGSLDRALDLVDAAADAGADAIKLQLFRASFLLSRASRLASYQAQAGESDPFSMLQRLELDERAMARIIQRAHARGVHAIVTPFSLELIDEAARLPWDAFKTASPDIINRPLLHAIRSLDRPVIVSTGAATLEEVERAIEWLVPSRGNLAVLQCVSSYPCAPENASIAGMAALARIFDGPIGYSDHTPSVDTGALAATFAPSPATILEKHLTYDTRAKGPDHAASLDPAAFRQYATLAREESALRIWMGEQAFVAPSGADPRLGPPEKRVLDCERDVRRLSRQSLVPTRAIRPGETIARADLTVKRPGTGLEPFRLEETIGRTARRAIEADIPLIPEDIA
jgi:N-acetylneuraminate synthase/N,N'-diacetyllegionaminate synthase